MISRLVTEQDAAAELYAEARYFRAETGCETEAVTYQLAAAEQSQFARELAGQDAD